MQRFWTNCTFLLVHPAGVYLGYTPFVVAAAAGCGGGVLALGATWAVGWLVGRGVAKLKVQGAQSYETFENDGINDCDL